MGRVVFIVPLLTFIGWQSASANLTVTPRDTESKVSDSTYFNCTTDILSKEIHWSHGSNYVYAGGSFYEPYLGRFQIEINNSTGVYNLVIPSVQPQDAGEYSCQDDGGHGKQSPTAKLIVLADDPTCHSDLIRDGNSCGIDPGEVKLSCSITYHGNIPPQLQWRKASDNSSIATTASDASGNSTTYTVTLKTDLSMHNQIYVCQTTRSVASQYHCDSKPIILQYVFSGNETVNITTDEEVNCFANSSQSCNYKWKWFSGIDSEIVSTNQTLKPTRVGSHRCEATCDIGNKPCTVNVTFAEVYSAAAVAAIEASAGQYLWVLWLLLVIVPIVLIAVGLFCWRCKKSSKKGEPVSQEVQTIKSEQSAMLLTAENGENNEQVKQSHAEPNKDLKEEVLSITSDHSSMPLIPVNAEDNKQVKQIHAEPNEDLNEDVPTIRSDQSAMPLIAENGGDNGQVKQSHAEPNKDLKEVETNRTDQSTKLTDKNQVKQSQQRLTEPDKASKGLSLLEGKPENVGAIDRKDEKGKRITVSNDKLFVATENSPDLQIYDVTKNCVFIKTVRIPGMLNPFDLVCCHATKCLFVSDCKLKTDQNEIIRIEPDMTVFKRWSTVKEFGNLSVSNESNIIQCVSNLSRLIECTRDGKFIRAIPLPGLVHPCHAIKLNSGEFVVSHGCKNDALHQVCCVNEDGKVLRSFGGEKGTSLQQLNEPKYLIVEEGNILVLDSSNKRILLLDSDLSVKREFLNKYAGVLSPDKMCLSKATRNLFVVDSQYEVLIISIK